MTIVVDASVALRWCFHLNGSGRAEDLLRSDDHLIAPDLVIAEIANAAWKFVIFDRVPADAAMSAVREVAKAFEELVPTSLLKDRALAMAIELRHPAYDCFYLALAERSASPLVTADDGLIRRCSSTPFEKLVRSL
jgi:predicted nucleic acid-binding protein